MFSRSERFQYDSHWRDDVLFYEHFHGDTGAGVEQAIRRAGLG